MVYDHLGLVVHYRLAIIKNIATQKNQFNDHNSLTINNV